MGAVVRALPPSVALAGAVARAPTARCARNAGKLAADGTSAACAASGRLCRGASEPPGRVARASPCAPTPLDAGRLGSQGELERTASPRAATEEGAPPRQLQKDEGGCWWWIRRRRG
jgi:hypothetical protein